LWREQICTTNALFHNFTRIKIDIYLDKTDQKSGEIISYYPLYNFFFSLLSED